MEPEEIDKLFRDKLAGRPALPSPEAWMRLQQKMEPPKKEKTMWIYYAAASVVLLLMAGLLYFHAGQQAPGPGLATAPKPEIQPAATLPEKAARPGNTRPVPLPLAGTNPSKRDASPPAASEQVQLPDSRPAENRVVVKRSSRHRQVQPEAPMQMAGKELDQKSAADQSAPTLAALPDPKPAVASATPDLSVVEVKVQRHAEAGEEPGLRGNLNRKGQLLKNIYKQARNLKNGEPVELAALGVKEGRLQEETKELKQKISNVISL